MKQVSATLVCYVAGHVSLHIIALITCHKRISYFSMTVNSVFYVLASILITSEINSP